MYVYLHLTEIRTNYLTTPTTLLKEIILVTQLLHQPLHIYKIYKIYTLKH